MSRPEAKTAAGAVKAKTESQTLIKAYPSRLAAYITNDGEKVVYLALGATAVKNEGIRLNEKGGAIVIEGYTGVISVVTAAEESVVTFAEV